MVKIFTNDDRSVMLIDQNNVKVDELLLMRCLKNGTICLEDFDPRMLIIDPRSTDYKQRFFAGVGGLVSSVWAG